MSRLYNRLISLKLPGEKNNQFVLRIGTTVQALYTWKKGRTPMMDSLIKISKATGVTIRWLKDGKGPKFGPPLFEESKKSARGLTDKRRAEFAASHWADMDKVPKKDRDAVMAMIVDMQSDPKLRSVLVEHYQFMSQKKKRKRK